jgi:hypothetical protein
MTFGFSWVCGWIPKAGKAAHHAIRNHHRHGIGHHRRMHGAAGHSGHGKALVWACTLVASPVAAAAIGGWQAWRTGHAIEHASHAGGSGFAGGGSGGIGNSGIGASGGGNSIGGSTESAIRYGNSGPIESGASVGKASNQEIVNVPEPGSGIILLTGIGILWLTRNKIR